MNQKTRLNFSKIYTNWPSIQVIKPHELFKLLTGIINFSLSKFYNFIYNIDMHSNCNGCNR